jgi:hypothetical protein
MELDAGHRRSFKTDASITQGKGEKPDKDRILFVITDGGITASRRCQVIAYWQPNRRTKVDGKKQGKFDVQPTAIASQRQIVKNQQ